MNKLRQDIRDAWLSGLTIKEIVEANVPLLTQQQYMVLWAQWHECEREFVVADQIIRSTAKR
jgi:hypothetical protein